MFEISIIKDQRGIPLFEVDNPGSVKVVNADAEAVSCKLTTGNDIIGAVLNHGDIPNIVTNTPLLANATFTQSTIDRQEQEIPIGSTRIWVNADQSGTLYLEESHNGTNWTTTATNAVSAGVQAIRDWTVLTRRYCRVRYVNGATAQGSFKIQQYFIGVGVSPVRAEDGTIVTIGSKSDAPVTDPTTSGSEIALLKGLIKQLQGSGTGALPVSNINLDIALSDLRDALQGTDSKTLADIVSKLDDLKTEIDLIKNTDGIKKITDTVNTQILGSISGKTVDVDNNNNLYVNIAPLNKDYDSIDVAKMSKAGITIAHNAISATATSEEIDCDGFNSMLVHVVIAGTGTWKIDVQCSPLSAGTFVDSYDGANQLTTGNLTASACVLFRGVMDYVKIVATEVVDGAACTVTVQPLNL